MSADALRCFAVRQVNPYAGLLQVVEAVDARAYSANGRVWQIQVIAERPEHTWRSIGQLAPIRQFFSFGLWDPEGGLHQVPANPMLDIGAMSTAADRLTNRLGHLSDALPFPLVDHIECWASDPEGMPVALLATAEEPSMIRDRHIEGWWATGKTDQRFLSPSLLAAGIPADDVSGPRRHAAWLEGEVNRLGRRKIWYDRSEPGRARQLNTDGLAEADVSIVFPPLGLKTDWPDALTERLASDYIDWQAPQLLMLPHLSDELRHRLEQAACRRAVELSTVYPLLPRIVDRTAVEAARVEAELRRAGH